MNVVKEPKQEDCSHSKSSVLPPLNTWNVDAAGTRPGGRTPGPLKAMKGLDAHACVRTELRGKKMSMDDYRTTFPYQNVHVQRTCNIQKKDEDNKKIFWKKTFIKYKFTNKLHCQKMKRE